jgi:hypothetical protein
MGSLREVFVFNEGKVADASALELIKWWGVLSFKDGNGKRVDTGDACYWIARMLASTPAIVV